MKGQLSNSYLVNVSARDTLTASFLMNLSTTSCGLISQNSTIGRAEMYMQFMRLNIKPPHASATFRSIWSSILNYATTAQPSLEDQYYHASRINAGEPVLDPPERLIDILAQTCSLTAIERARRAAHDKGERVDKIMLSLGLVSELTLAEAYSTLLRVPIADPTRYPDKPLFYECLRPSFLRKANACPLAIEDGGLVIAVSDGLDDFTPKAISFAVGLPVRVEIAVPFDLEAAFRRLYPKARQIQAETQSDSVTADEEDAERLQDLANQTPIIVLVNEIICRAVESKASDIHVEPKEDHLCIRYRYDGILHEGTTVNASSARAVISRMKIMSKLDIAERRLPQDGRIRLPVRGTEIDFRVSTIPSLHGETVVLRILDRTSVAFDYKELGLSAQVVSAWKSILARPNGIILVTGPTGSGKTTTLYTGLTGINAITRKIVTIEDPIEYQLSGITQTQIKPQIDLTFAALLRSILRQDPDVIMVGEIRDLETARIAAQAALTGHLVLSTLHTNSATAAIIRLRDIGLEDYLVSSVLRGVLAQRLVRRLCKECKREYIPSKDLADRYELGKYVAGKEIRLWHSVGCKHCRDTGYKGRRAIAELLIPTQEIEDMIVKSADQCELERAARACGMRTLWEEGLDAALSGETTIEEILRNLSM